MDRDRFFFLSSRRKLKYTYVLCRNGALEKLETEEKNKGGVKGYKAVAVGAGGTRRDGKGFIEGKGLE